MGIGSRVVHPSQCVTHDASAHPGDRHSVVKQDSITPSSFSFLHSIRHPAHTTARHSPHTKVATELHPLAAHTLIGKNDLTVTGTPRIERM